MKLTEAAILVSRGMNILQATPAAYPYRSEAGVLTHFQQLLDNFPLIREEVAALESPNAEDDEPVKFAIVGYSYNRPVEHWGREELDFVTHRRHEVADFNPLWIDFTCLALGYLIGLYQAGRCSDQEFALFEAQLPGFMWLHSEQFTTA